MLIYNYQKEFLGIDERDLHTLGFQDLGQLRAEVVDFSDLFVKTPGYIHNFKHVHWIDFITCADSSEESKVIISVNNKNYKCTIQIATAYLVDNPSSKAYLISLNNLRELTAKESESISGDISQRSVPQASTAPAKQIFNTPDITPEETIPPVEETAAAQNITVDPYEAPLEVDFHDEVEHLNVDVYDTPAQTQDYAVDSTPSPDPITKDIDLPLDIELEEQQDEEIVIAESTPQPQKVMQTVVETFDNGYVYDPSVASEELGLPLDLIEEFIQDFIEQAKEFKDGLYKALDENDMDNLKILSHKLKGVAANLRIEDALESLTIINTSSNVTAIKENLDILYKIIAKLAGEEIKVEKEVELTPTTVETPQVPQELEQEAIEEPAPLAQKANIREEIPIQEDAPLDLLDIDIPFQEEEALPQKDTPLDLPDIDTPFQEEATLPQEDAPLDLLEIEIPNEEESNSLPEIEIEYSKESVAHEIGLDIDSFNELFEDYIDEAKSTNETIQSAIQNDDFNSCRDGAIQLKGMSGNMRVDIYSDALDILINSTNKQELEQATKMIETAIAQLSNTGVK